VGKLAVARELKGTGFTKQKLLTAISLEAQERNLNELRLTCLSHNPRLINFYVELGFVEVDTRAGVADAGYEVEVKEMSLQL
jgi:GNAT superfamily N-acetyltransferase